MPGRHPDAGLRRLVEVEVYAEIAPGLERDLMRNLLAAGSVFAPSRMPVAPAISPSPNTHPSCGASQPRSPSRSRSTVVSSAVAWLQANSASSKWPARKLCLNVRLRRLYIGSACLSATVSGILPS
jgi:hypothetical protein